MVDQPTFRRFETAGLTSLAPLLRGQSGGIYLLEFADGTEYVGQTVNFVTRLANHAHGGKHHQPWTDIVAVSILNVPLDQLNVWERRIIEQERSRGATLRNKVFNIGFAGPSVFDAVIPVEQQTHWALGDGDFGIDQYRAAAQRDRGPTPKLLQSPLGKRAIEGADSVADVVIEILALLIGWIIPDAPHLEGEYWTLTDFPSTAGGRFATLNVGSLELAYFPRWVEFPDHSPAAFVNFPRGTFDFTEDDEGRQISELPNGCVCEGGRNKYKIAEVDCVIIGLPTIAQFDPTMIELLRKFALDLMRRSDSRKFARWHSAELSRLVYQRICEIYDSSIG